MIAALFLEFVLLWLFDDFVKVDSSDALLVTVNRWLKTIWGAQLIVTITYLAWKYLP